MMTQCISSHATVKDVITKEKLCSLSRASPLPKSNAGRVS